MCLKSRRVERSASLGGGVRSFQVRIPAAAAVLVAAAVLGLVLRAASDVVSVEDRNLDGRADVRRTYDSRGRLTHVAIDTNFDGRWDVEEFYEDGTLARRESDRDFNNRADLVEEFDARTEEPTRSVVDLDSDGVADVLVLVADGHPVLAAWAPDETASRERSRSVAGAPSGEALAPLVDPFRGEAALRAARPHEATFALIAGSWGILSSPPLGLPAHAASTRPLVGAGIPSQAFLPRLSSRGPPVHSC